MMEDHVVVKKRSVAELAGKFSCQNVSVTDEVMRWSVRRRPPHTLQLSACNDAGQTPDEKGAESVSAKKNRNSALIEKLQASLTLSPTGPPAFPKSPGVIKLPVPSFFPTSPSSPPVILTPNQEEPPATFENTVEGGVLKSINKGRARHSVKRRPPSHKHRKSSAEDGSEEVSTPEHMTPNGHERDVFEEQKTSDCLNTSSKNQTELETTSTDAEQRHPQVAEPEKEVETAENKDGAEQEEKPEEEEKKSEDEERLDYSSSETEVQDEAREQPVTLAHEKPQTEPDNTTDEKETQQKEEAEINR